MLSGGAERFGAQESCLSLDLQEVDRVASSPQSTAARAQTWGEARRGIPPKEAQDFANLENLKNTGRNGF